MSCNPEVIEQLQIVERNSKSLLALINQLLDFRKIDSDGVEINMSNNNLIKLLNDVVVPFEMFAKERDIRILKYYHLPHPFFQYDETYMEKVIVNLLSNAIKFTPNSGCVKLYVCSLRNEKNEDLIYICVNDNGIGVSTDELEKFLIAFINLGKVQNILFMGKVEQE